MIEFDPFFRRLLGRYIKKTTAQKIDWHEFYIARGHQCRHDEELKERKAIELPDFKNAGDILEDFRKDYTRIQKMWISRRIYALEQGNFMQIPPTINSLVRYFSAAWRFYRDQLFGFLSLFSMNNILLNIPFVLALIAIIILLVLGIYWSI